MTIQPHKKFNILLIGDSCTDVYQFGVVDRISPEAPVPIFRPTHSYSKPGMALNVANNLEALGCTVGVVTGNASVKTRLIDQRSRQQLLRMDQDSVSHAVDIDNHLAHTYHAVVISDYNKGAVSYETIEQVLTQVKVPVFVDTKKTDLSRMQGAWVKINELEYNRLTSQCSGLIVTRGAQGAEIVNQGLTFAAPKVEVVDVTGAGDTFLAALTYQYLVSADIAKSVQYAIAASAITVQHLGVYAPTQKEIQ